MLLVLSASLLLSISLLSSVFAIQQVPFDVADWSESTSRHHKPQWNLTSLHNTTFHSAYHPLNEINRFMRELAVLHPGSVKRVKLGHSGQGREMYGLRIRKPKQKKSKAGMKETLKKKRLGFLVMGAQHAREWIGSAAALYIAHALVADHDDPGSLSKLLENFEFHIIPAPNPDGYHYTWGNDRFWYKNRMKLGPGKGCRGLDMNRNWGFQFDPTVANASQGVDPCGPEYPGRRPFEAPEVNSIANYVTRTKLKGFVDLGSYGQMISTPFSYSCDVLPPDAEDLLEAATGAAHAIKKAHGTNYVTGSLCSTLYSAPGNMLDWMYSEARVKYSFAVHLRDTGTYGYLLPAKWIRNVGEETGTLIEYLASFIVRPYNKGHDDEEELE